MNPETTQAETSQEPAEAPSSMQPRELLQKLQETSLTFREYRPLALRIDKAVMERFPDVSRKVVRTAMRMHTGSTRYLKSMEKATERFDLDGNTDGELTEEHRQHASETLKQRFADAAKRKRDQQKAEQARQREAEAEQRKAEKLSQLVEKFSGR